MRRMVTVALLVGSTLGCGSEPDSGDDTGGIDFDVGGPDEGTSTTGGEQGEDTGGVLDVGTNPTGGNGGDGGQCACQDVDDGIYVLDNAGFAPAVWFFDPPANTFTQVGTIGCDAPAGWVANSMAIDRQGYAWLNYYEQLTQSARIYRAPLADLSQCEDTGYVNPGGTWWLLGMGYAVVNADSSCDQLYIYRSDRYLEYPNFGPGGAELGQFNEATDAVDLIGATDYPVGELTGTGDGRLFTFAPVNANLAVLVNLDKATGGELEHTDLDGLDITNAFAFAFWGGDVYFFTETSPGSGVSQVTRLDYDGNEGGGLAVYNANTGLHIPGAGVSTCASFTPPA
ncbi:MAG: hypothetical protein K0V04_32040 [Deltaproteobacteria bacterium]|nr:hypothetical protein [Deltaproteobacteria bacterium]